METCMTIRAYKNNKKTCAMIAHLRQLLIIVLLVLVSGCTYMGTRTIPYNELAKKYSSDQSDYIDIDGLVIHYSDEGSGPPLLLLHGVASSLQTWDGWAKELKGKYRIIRLDLPGFGLTGFDHGGSNYDLNYMLDKVNRFTEEMGLSKFFVAGNSLGGYIAWNFAERYPEKIYKMVLVDAAGYPQDMPFWIGLGGLPVISTITEYMMPKPLVNWTVNSAYGDKSKITDEVRQRYFDMTQRAGNRKSYVDVFRATRQQSKNPAQGENVKNIVVPTLLMWGEKDTWIPLDIMRKFQRDLPYSDFIVYEGVGHLPMEELPVQTARDADNFFMAELKTPMQHAQESSIKYYDGGNYKQIAPEHSESPAESVESAPADSAEPTAALTPDPVQNADTTAALDPAEL